MIRRSYYDAWTIAQIADDLHVEDRVTATLHYGVRALLLSMQERGLTGPWGVAPSYTPSREGAEVTGCEDDTLQDQR